MANTRKIALGLIAFLALYRIAKHSAGKIPGNGSSIESSRESLPKARRSATAPDNEPSLMDIPIAIAIGAAIHASIDTNIGGDFGFSGNGDYN